MQCDKLILELAVLASATILVALDKLDPSVYIAILGVILGVRIYIAVRRRR